MPRQVSRRDFLKLGGLSLGVVAFNWPRWNFPLGPATIEPSEPIGKGRVTIRSIYIYSDADFQSERLGIASRDSLLPIFEEIQSLKGLWHNPRWYRLENGYVHSAYIQRVDDAHLNEPLNTIAENGRLGEISVPYTQSLRNTHLYGWTPLYRLYYQSVHWITGVEEGPDGEPWYELTDELLHVRYCVPATHVRPVEPEEISPISHWIPPMEKRIEVSIPQQTLIAYEGDSVVLNTQISSGIPGRESSPDGIPTATPEGNFHVEVKVPSKHMGDGKLTSDIHAYELLGVPWVSFFHPTGVAFHGTYWHDNFGHMMSHGCVNMRTEEAKWLYRWSLPTAEPQDWNRKGHGTLVWVG